MAIFDKTRVLTSRKYVVVQGMNIPKSVQKYKFFWHTPSFCFSIIASKMLIFETRLPLKEQLVATLCSCSRYEPSRIIRITQIALVALLRFCFRIITSKMLILMFSVPIRESLVATVSETHAVTSLKDMVKQGNNISKVREKHKLLWPLSSVFALE